jgi:dTDP-4-dehydrorhamnose reductase
MNKVVITGGSGLLAINWADVIHDEYLVTLILHTRSISIPGINVEKISIDSIDSIEKMVERCKPDIIINAAGITNVEECEKNPELAKKVNVDIAKNLAIVSNKYKIKFVQISTDHLFSGERQMMSEVDLVSPKNIYALTKYEAETKVQESCPDALIIRTNFYGWGSSYRKSFSDYIIDSLRLGKEITLFDDVFFTPIFIKNLVLSVHNLINLEKRGVFNIAGDKRVTKFYFGKKIAEIFKLDSNLIRLGYLKNRQDLINRPFDMSLSNNKISHALGNKVGAFDEGIMTLKKLENNRIVL